MKRFNTHIIMVSGQATPNVLAVMDKTIRPEEVILCATDDMHEKSEILKRYFTRHQIRCREVKLGNAYDFASIRNRTPSSTFRKKTPPNIRLPGN